MQIFPIPARFPDHMRPECAANVPPRSPAATARTNLGHCVCLSASKGGSRGWGLASRVVESALWPWQACVRCRALSRAFCVGARATCFTRRPPRARSRAAPGVLPSPNAVRPLAGPGGIDEFPLCGDEHPSPRRGGGGKWCRTANANRSVPARGIRAVAGTL